MIEKIELTRTPHLWKSLETIQEKINELVKAHNKLVEQYIDHVHGFDPTTNTVEGPIFYG